MTSDLIQEIQASGKQIPADLVVKNGKIVNVFTRQIMETDLAIKNGKVVGFGSYEGK